MATEFLGLEIKAEDQATPTLERVEKGLERQAKLVSQMAREANVLNGALSKIDRTYASYARATAQATSAEAKLLAERRKASAALRKSAQEQSGYVRGLQTFNGALTNSSGGLKGLTNGLTQGAAGGGAFGLALAASSAGLVAFNAAADITANVVTAIFGELKTAASTAVTFEAAIQRVAATTGNVSKNLNILESAAKRAGSETIFSATQSAGALQELVQAGLTAQQSTAALASSLTLAQASGQDTSKTADVLTNVLSGYNLEAEKASYVTDLIITGFQSANTDALSFGRALQGAVAIGKGYGQTLESIATVQAAVANTGIRGDKAARAYRRALSELSKGLPRTTNTLAKLNVTSTDANGNMRDLVEIIKDLNKAGASAKDVENIFGAFAGPALAPLILNNVDALDKLRVKFDQASGAGGRFTAEVAKTAEASLKSLESRLEAVRISVGDRFTPAIAGVATVLSRQLGLLAQNSEFLNEFDEISLAVVDTVSQLLLVGADLVPFFAKVTGVTLEAGRAFGVLAQGAELAARGILAGTAAASGNFVIAALQVKEITTQLPGFIGKANDAVNNYGKAQDAATKAGEVFANNMRQAAGGLRTVRGELVTTIEEQRRLNSALAVVDGFKATATAVGFLTNKYLELNPALKANVELYGGALVGQINKVAKAYGFAGISAKKLNDETKKAPEPPKPPSAPIQDRSKEAELELRIAKETNAFDKIALEAELEQLRIKGQRLTQSERALRVEIAQVQEVKKITDELKKQRDLIEKRQKAASDALTTALSKATEAARKQREAQIDTIDREARVLKLRGGLDNERLAITRELDATLQRIEDNKDLSVDQRRLAIEEATLKSVQDREEVEKRAADEAQKRRDKASAAFEKELEQQRKLFGVFETQIARAGELESAIAASDSAALDRQVARLEAAKELQAAQGQDVTFLERRIEALKAEGEQEKVNQELLRERITLTGQALNQGAELITQIRLAASATTDQAAAQNAQLSALQAGVSLSGALSSIFVKDIRTRAKVEGAINAAASVASLGAYAYSGFTAQNFLLAGIQYGVAAGKFFAVSGAGSGSSRPSIPSGSTGSSSAPRPQTSAPSRQDRQSISALSDLRALQLSQGSPVQINVTGNTFLESSPSTQRRLNEYVQKASNLQARQGRIIGAA